MHPQSHCAGSRSAWGTLTIGLGLTLALGLGWIAARQTAAAAQSTQPAASAPGDEQAHLEALLPQLGDEDHLIRERATQSLLKLGPRVAARLQERLVGETDPEIRHRLRFVLECIVPPDSAVLVLNAAPESGLLPGDLITHVGPWRIRHAAELRNLIAESGNSQLSLRVAGAAGPRDLSRFDRRQLYAFCDYVTPRGARVAEALRLFDGGFVERAAESVDGLGQDLGEEEMPTLARARVLATAGRVSDALRLLATAPDVVKPGETENKWLAPSTIDRVLPGKAPFYLEWTLWNLVREGVEDDGDPDLRTQRILVPANRFLDALHSAAGYWTTRFRDALGSDERQTRNAGNMLAVSSWMLSELSLLSECQRLIEPRSVILRDSPNSPRKWMRVQTDAWLPYFAGDSDAAATQVFRDAFEVLQNPLGLGPGQVLIRNPAIAAQLAFFLYQSPADPRIREALDAVNRTDHPALAAYVDWMMHALREDNAATIRAHVGELSPKFSAPFGAESGRLLRARALLEYVCDGRDPTVLQSLRDALTGEAGPHAAPTAATLVLALAALAEGRLDDARQALADFDGEPGYAVLLSTVEFRQHPPAGAGVHAALQAPLMATPLGASRDTWVVLTADRQLQIFDVRSGELTPLDRPTPNWFPGPRNWPWLGRDERSGRVFVYGVRRVLELGSDATPDAKPLRMNIRTEDIAAFDQLVAPVFGAVAEAVLAGTPEAGEDGEFLRSELRENLEYTPDPDLPELAMIRPAVQDDRLVHIAFRGGPHLLLDRREWKVRSGLSIAAALALPRTPSFFVEAAWRDGEAPPMALLPSDQGLIRYQGATGEFDRIALPGDEPHPALLPESAPYVRRDPRWIYFARTPEEGGQVYRLAVETNRIEAVDLINMTVPEEYYTVRRRSELRRQIDQLFESSHIQPLEAYVGEVVQTVARWKVNPQ